MTADTANSDNDDEVDPFKDMDLTFEEVDRMLETVPAATDDAASADTTVQSATAAVSTTLSETTSVSQQPPPVGRRPGAPPIRRPPGMDFSYIFLEIYIFRDMCNLQCVLC